MNGYRSIDGDCEINAKISIYQEVIDGWDSALAYADEIEKVLYDADNDMYYLVRRFSKTSGDRYFRYKVYLMDAMQHVHYIILIDTKGGAKIEIHYPAQRDSQRLNLDYRKWFKYMHIRLLQEQVSRVDLAITIERSAASIIRDILDDKCKTVLSRKTIVTYGGADNPTSLRMGLISNVQVAVYDKSLEVVEKSFKLNYRLKPDDYVKYFGEKTGVTRIEYRIGRKYLRNTGFESPEDVNNEIVDLWASMEQIYFCPTKQVNDHKHEPDDADWWHELPDIEVRSRKSDNVYNRMVARNSLHHVAWKNKYKMMRDRAYGYLASIVVSIAGVRGDVDNALNVVYRRLWRDSEEIKLRALTRFALP